jgi:F-type H+-transporting ATPase subunit b
MIIDWFTVGAQALNFVILVWLLKRLLYKPILDAIDAREKRIAAELADADAKKAEAKRERDEFQNKNKEFDEQRAALVNRASEEAQTEAQRLLGEARRAADTLRADRHSALEREHQSLSDEITRRTAAEVFAIARKVLTDLAATSLEERLVEVFARRLRELEGTAKEELAAALGTAPGPALVRSAFELPAPQRAAIQNALNETFAAAIPVAFETAPDVISGIELTAQGRRVAWTISEYLASLQARVGELFEEQPPSEGSPDTRKEPVPQAPAAPAETP